MELQPVIAIFDIGKTNKKFFLFNEQYHIVHEQIIHIDETMDEDGFPCDDVAEISAWVKKTLSTALQLPGFLIKAVNVSAYGASFCHLDKSGVPVTPLYNYLKPFPQTLQQSFYDAFGGEDLLSVETASPVLGSLNAGLQLYRLQQQRAQVYANIHTSLHLPQYISFLISGKANAEITSIGCHTLLWDFIKNDYHLWVYSTGIVDKFPAIQSAEQVSDAMIEGHYVKVGAGLHDSSAALIPYLACFPDPFILISTGTWCISLNPFNKEPLTREELTADCLSYLDYQGHPVKAARIFAGNEHEMEVRKLAVNFGLPVDHYKEIVFDAAILPDGVSEEFPDYAKAYHALVYSIIQQQKRSTARILSADSPKQIFVDGGFATNPLYMHLLAAAFPSMKVFAATVSQASAMGAALAIHPAWNTQPVPADLIQLQYFPADPSIEV